MFWATKIASVWKAERRLYDDNRKMLASTILKKLSEMQKW